MKIGLKLLVSILQLVSIGLVAGNQLTQSVNLGPSTPSLQIDQSPADGSLASANNLVSELKVFVGSIKSNKYYYPSCGSAKSIHSENEIWFSSSQDARAHGYVPCQRCHPP